MRRLRKVLPLLLLGAMAVGCTSTQEKPTAPFPFIMPVEKPDIALSPAMERVYDNYGAATPQVNELFTNFKYTNLEGFDYNGHDGTITRRDPSRIVKTNGKYYVWYTKRHTSTVYQNADLANDTIASTDWDLCDIAYATSKDGFTWEEQGIAVPRPPKPTTGWRSVSTPDILVWKGKYYLYYQAFSEISGKRGDDCPVAMSYSDSPDGPWTPLNKVVVPNGEAGSWDQYSIHDPQPVVMNGKIYLYYKSDYNSGDPRGLIRSQGLAIAEDPAGPFVKYEHNPVISSGHETNYFRFKEGIAALLIKDGHEHNTIQYSPDGKNFEIASFATDMTPDAGAMYDPDAFTDTDYARGVTWGLCHYCIWGPQRHTIMLRYDCDLSLDVNDPWMKKNYVPFSLEETLRRGLSKDQKARILKANQL